MKHILRIGDLAKEEILAILERAEELRNGAKPRIFPRKVLGLLFFQPSTRTRFGLAAAVARLGGSSICLDKAKFQTGMAEAESFEDTLRSISGYCDAFALRHEDEDSIDRAAVIFESAPLINAGNGNDEHPTQALIDLFAIQRWHGHLDGLRIGIVGDLSGSRACHSLIASIWCFAPQEVRLMKPRDVELPSKFLASSSLGLIRTSPDLAFENLDVLYFAGFPKGTGRDAHQELSRLQFRLSEEHLALVPPNCVILSPLPRIDEIDPVVDRTPNARYFQQSMEGLFVRIATIERVLGKAAN